jgi:hypothetical protein
MKIWTEEERQRYEAERDAEPYMPGFTRGEFDRLPKRRQEHETQKAFQIATSSLGYWKTCGLSPCRRAKACRGFLTEAQATAGGYHTSFPPCIRDGAYRQEATLKETARLYGLEDEEPGYPEKRDW